MQPIPKAQNTRLHRKSTKLMCVFVLVGVCVRARARVCALTCVRVRVCSKKHTRVSLQPSLLLCSPAPPLPYPISPNSFIHYFACAFYRVKKETNSPEDVDSFYTSRASDPNVRDEMIRN